MVYNEWKMLYLFAITNPNCLGGSFVKQRFETIPESAYTAFRLVLSVALFAAEDAVHASGALCSVFSGLTGI